MGAVAQVYRTEVGTDSFCEENQQPFYYSEYGRIGRIHEELLKSEFAQIAHQTRDIMLYGEVQPETYQRVTNELVGMALEKLGKPFVTNYDYALIGGRIVAEDGESFVSLNQRGLDEATRMSDKNYQLEFLRERRRADLLFAQSLERMALDPSQPVGSCVVVASACPDARELGVSQKLLVDNFYQPEIDQAVVWVATKTASGINLQTVNLFHASPELLATSLAYATNSLVPVDQREQTPWRHIKTDNNGEFVSNLLATYDSLATQSRGEPTFHGLVKGELPDFVRSEQFIEDKQFQKTLLATHERFAEIARSLADGKSHVPIQYIDAILELRTQDGTFELFGDKREALLALRNGTVDYEKFRTSLMVVKRAAEAGLWAELARVYHGDGRQAEHAATVGSDSVGSSIQSLKEVSEQRSYGRSELGCPGGGGNIESAKGLFELSTNGLLSEIFSGTKVIKTNCPMCNEKDIKAEIKHGKITCKNCDACVEICTGKTVRRSKKTKKAATSIAKKTIKTTLKFFDFRKQQKPAKHEKIAA
ncbi:MAG TPA: hypothetical protein PJ984_00865 [Candidatus Saccharibacteria bacterium]|jgi:hypothetical protein|nr:hypothetical protein [Candidatus Saccharibacteria bacterium]